MPTAVSNHMIVNGAVGATDRRRPRSNHPARERVFPVKPAAR